MTVYTPDQRQILAAARMIKRGALKALRAKARAARVKPDRGRERDNAYLAWLRRQPCVALHMGGCEGPIEACHIRFSRPGEPNPGMQRKNHDRNCVAACRRHHQEQHGMNERAWWASIGKDAYATAAALYARFNEDTENPL